MDAMWSLRVGSETVAVVAWVAAAGLAASLAVEACDRYRRGWLGIRLHCRFGADFLVVETGLREVLWVETEVVGVSVRPDVVEQLKGCGRSWMGNLSQGGRSQGSCSGSHWSAMIVAGEGVWHCSHAEEQVQPQYP